MSIVFDENPYDSLLDRHQKLVGDLTTLISEVEAINITRCELLSRLRDLIQGESKAPIKSRVDL